MHGVELAQSIYTDKFYRKIFGTNRAAKRTRIVNRYFCKKGYRDGIKIKAKR